VFDPAESDTLSLDLLDGIDVASASDDEIARIVGRAVVDAASSYIPGDWAGVRWQQLARAAGEIAITAATTRELRYEDIGRLMIDERFLAEVLDGHARADSHSALVLRQLTREQDKAGTGLWASAKFDSIARSVLARTLFAPFGQGVSVRRLIDDGIPLVAALNDGSRVEARLAGHIFLTSVLDYALTRPTTKRTPLYLFVDEASTFPAAALARALAEGRKFGLQVYVANQSISQISDLVDALAANAGRIMFRLGMRDAHALAPLMGVGPDDLTGQANLTALAQLPGRSAFTVRFDPPPAADDLPPYRRPAQLDREYIDRAVGTASGADANRHVPRQSTGHEIWSMVMDRLHPASSANRRLNSWTLSVLDTRLTDDRFEIVVEQDFMRDWIAERHLALLQRIVADVTQCDLDVVVCVAD
jgi:hypothetical protein